MNFIKKTPKIILIAGRAESGKSTLAKNLKLAYESQNKKVILSPYSKYLKYYIEEITSQKIIEDNKPRDMLQQISSKIIKGQLNKKSFFIDRQIEDINIYSYFADIIIIPDVRFPDEIHAIKENFKDVISIGIIRQNHVSLLTKEQLEDDTETALNNYHAYDFEIENTESTDLQKVAEELIKKLKEKDR